MRKETLINTSLQRGDKDFSQGRERFQPFPGKPLKRLDDPSAEESTSLKRGVTEMERAVNNLSANTRFQNALARIPQATPPIWLMRQAGRYHRHYQDLRRQFSFMDLCKQPELAAHVALGPVLDFDFDAAILFSDLLFPLEALGMGLDYTDAGPQLGWHLTAQTVERLRGIEEAWPHLLFQGHAVRETRTLLPDDKSLIGFVGGPWTLFVYAVEGTHKNVERAVTELKLFEEFSEMLVPLLIRNIEIQLANGAEVVMIFDTAAGELAPEVFQTEVVPHLERLTSNLPSRLGYYSKATTRDHLNHNLFTNGDWAGIGVDHHWDLREAFDMFAQGFVQGNFDQNLLLASRDELKSHLEQFLKPLLKHDRTGWICGLGHGVLPKTPEENVRLFVNTVREVSQ
ncbi:MAG TPA: uroporphyrinogen decarboxylase family protein [Pyrinomonadaceae bacterium]|jgi:uroporphyrinogen decarboxylase